MITSPVPATVGGRSLTTGVHPVKRPKSIWFDTGEGDPGPAPSPEPVHAAPVVAADPPAPPEPAPAGDPAQDSASVAQDSASVRLPIFDSVESEWFRRGTSVWTSPADEGFRVAQTIVGAPLAGQTTSAGLPRRVPSANLVPGSISPRPPRERAGRAPSPAGGPVRSPEAVRARLTGFQVHGREGRFDGSRPAASAD